MKYDSSSLIFSYFNRVGGNDFAYVYKLLVDLVHGSTDIEKVLLHNLIGDVSVTEDNVDEAVKDPKNIVSFDGFPYEQVRYAIRAEFVLLKILFAISHEYGGYISSFIETNYKRKYKQMDKVPFAINNVLQLCPGIMTLIFYIINKFKDKEGIEELNSLNLKLLTLTNVKGQAGKQEAIETHKSISKLIEKVGNRCIDILVTNKDAKAVILDYSNLLFLRSGLIKDSSQKETSGIIY